MFHHPQHSQTPHECPHCHHTGGSGTFILGVVIGAVLGVLYAPAKGSATLKKVKSEAENLKRKAGPIIDELKETAAPKINKALEKIGDELEKQKSRSKKGFFKGLN